MKLVVQVTVDQLRGDLPLRFEKRFGTGGFRRFLDHGLVYTNAHHDHSATYTAVGHATLVTGGYAAQHGLPANDWFDQESGSRVYNVEDSRHHIIGAETKAYQGTSPRNLTSTTIGDEVVAANGGQARAFSVSVKDRAAIIPGGHRGTAYWYQRSTGHFITSTYYADDHPDWVTHWNGRALADQYRNGQWRLLADRSTYLHADADDRPSERGYRRLGRTFPHPLANPNREDYYATLRYTPIGDELTLDFTRELVRSEKLGQGDTTDYLAVSLSSTDYIGHAYGPSSLEVEDNLLRLDRTLASFFAFIDHTIGPGKTLFVLSSDHGTGAIPEHSTNLGLDAGRHRLEELIARLEKALAARHSCGEPLVAAFWTPSVFFDLDAVERCGLNVSLLEETAAGALRNMPGIALAVTRTDLLNGRAPEGPIGAMILKGFHPQRTGNVLVIQDRLWFLSDEPSHSAVHGSPYNYDTFVPIMFAGPSIPCGRIHRRTRPLDIAPTIAAYLDIPPPSGCVGDVLVDVLSP